MADGKEKEWCSFGEFSSSEFNLSTNETYLDNKKEYVDEEGGVKWDANFENIFDVGSSSHTQDDDDNNSDNWFHDDSETVAQHSPSQLNHHSLEKETVDATNKCFCQNSLKVPLEEKECGINGRYIKSTLYSSLQSDAWDPIKWDGTYFHRLKLRKIASLLHATQVVENWIAKLNQVNTRIFEDHFDYHTSVDGHKNMSSSSSSPKVGGKGIVRNGEVIKETLLLDNSISIDKNIESNLRKVNTHTKSVLPLAQAMKKKTSADLEGKSLEEIKTIVTELQNQANSYSEILLNELDYRDRLKRDIEGQNNFISSHVAVERKMNQELQTKKKKSRYGFFKQNEDESKPSASIPYIHRDGGPKSSDLALMTEILKAMERDDHGVSKLISDYVLKLGDQHNLQTVIQVRTRNGVVTSLSTPEHKKQNFNDTNNV